MNITLNVPLDILERLKIEYDLSRLISSEEDRTFNAFLTDITNVNLVRHVMANQR